METKRIYFAAGFVILIIAFSAIILWQRNNYQKDVNELRNSLSKQTEQSNSFSVKITDLEKENKDINVKSSTLINENDGLKKQLANISCKESGIMYFYGKECPHCQEVEKFLADNKISDKVKYNSLEVWHNQENAKVMKEKAQECGLPTDQIGVPFVYSGGKCYVGAPKVEDFFKQTAETQ